MKKIALEMTLMAVMTSAWAQNKGITVESDQVLNTDFSKYKTFSFASMIDSDLEVGFYFLNDLIMKSQIREAVRDELLGLGYKFDRENPDLIVNFRVFEKPTTLKGYEGYGTSYWGGAKYRQISDSRSYDVKAGTILINFADTKTSQVVWQGFASGLIDNNKFIKDEGKIREAVNMIMDEYGHRAKEYTRK
jgi:hypothetical protein